jgi:hypothetical protein
MEPNKTFDFHKAARILIIVFAAAIGTIAILVILKFMFLYSTYSFFFSKGLTVFGLDSMIARAFAVFFTVGSLMITPWIISFLLFGRRKMELALVLAVSCVAFSLGTYYITHGVYFNRADGQPVKCFAKTLDGFKFSSVCDYDPGFGIKYEPISDVVAKEIYFWEKSGKLKSVPQVQIGKYFDSLTGDPIVWYIERGQEAVSLFALPGHDPLTGKLLKPITADVVAKITCDYSDVPLASSVSSTPSVDDYLLKREALAKKEKILYQGEDQIISQRVSNYSGLTEEDILGVASRKNLESGTVRHYCKKRLAKESGKTDFVGGGGK